MPRKPRNTTDDIGFENGKPTSFGEIAAARNDEIFRHPDTVPVLMIARLGDDFGVRVFGPPSMDTVRLLEHLTESFREAVKATKPQGKHRVQ